jgi:hypothetical protein
VADLNFPAGVGTETNAFVGFRGYFGTITIPAGPHQTSNGEFPIRITAVETYVGGGANTLSSNQSTTPAYVARDITLQIDNASTAQFTVAGGPPVATGFRGISKSYGGSTTATFRVVNAFSDAYLRYGWRTVAGYQMFALANDLVSSAGVLRSGAAAGPTGTIRYIYAPNNPSNLRATSSTATSINLAWNAPTNNGETGITGYRLERSTVSNFSSGVVATDLSNVTSTTVSSLLEGTTYYFRIAARNAVTQDRGTWSTYSNTLTKAATPSTPTLTVSRTGLLYSLSASSTISSGSISSYEYSVRSSTDGGVTFGSYSNIVGLIIDNVASFTSSPARSYQFRARALSSEGVFGDYATSSIFHTPNVPLIPTTAISLSKNVRKVTVDWDPFRTNANAITNYNGAIISGYQVEERYSIDGGVTWTSYSNIASTNASTTVFLTNDLLIAKTYQFRVRANSDVGFSAYQDSSIVFISAYGQRRDASGFVPTENAKRFDGTSWITIGMVKRFNGTTWVDIQN